MPRKKGTPKTGGRAKGTPNKTTAAVKNYITQVLSDYMQPAPSGSKKPTLATDIAAMLPEDRVRAMTQLAGYVIPKQQALSVAEQTQVEADALTEWLETAPDEAINAIAAKVLEMQARNAAAAELAN
jgi:hypothetical protein